MAAGLESLNRHSREWSGRTTPIAGRQIRHKAHLNLVRLVAVIINRENPSVLPARSERFFSPGRRQRVESPQGAAFNLQLAARLPTQEIESKHPCFPGLHPDFGLRSVVAGVPELKCSDTGRL